MVILQVLTLLAFVLFTVQDGSSDTDEPKQPNVLFLVADDMRPDIGIYKPGQGFHTPNLDSLASRSLLLKNAYVQEAICAPSRTSFLTSRRPDTSHVYYFNEYFRDLGGNFTTIPQYFKDRGYFTKGIGKIFHSGPSSNYDDPISWNEPYYHAPNFELYDSFNYSWKAVSDKERAELPLPDDQIANHAIETLRSIAPEARSGDQPFFLAVGFRKPHLSFVFPESFMEHYPEVQLPANPFVPTEFPFIAWHQCDQLALKNDITSSMDFNIGLSEEKTLELRRAYYSCISYIDSLVGMILKELKNLELEENTIVSFIGDHGWTLVNCPDGKFRGNPIYWLLVFINLASFVFPKSFLELYPEVQLSANSYVPTDFRPIAWNKCSGLGLRKDVSTNIKFNIGLFEEKKLEVRRACYSSISYILDPLVRTIHTELENYKMKENTVVSFVGDHRWQLGEHNEWCKLTNFELALQAPMMIHIPGLTDSGITTNYITEFLDLFPTIVEAAGFPSLPICPSDSQKVELCTEGKSLMPLILGNTELMYSRKYTENVNIAFSQTTKISDHNAMGYTMRTPEFRYTEWVKFNDTNYIADWDNVLDVELYDHVKDPDENHNVAYKIEYSNVRIQLGETLREKNKKT